MSATFRDSSSNQANSSAPQLTIPGTVQVGDWGVVHLTIFNPDTAITVPTGWTAIVGPSDYGSGTNDIQLLIKRKFAAGDSRTLAFTAQTSVHKYAVVGSWWTNTDGFGTTTQSIRSVTATTQTAPAATTAVAGETVVVTFLDRNSSTTSIAVSPTTTTRESVFGSGGSHESAYMGSYTVSGSAAVRTATYDVSGSKGVGTQIRVIDASSSTIQRAANVYASGSWHQVPSKVYYNGKWVEVLLKRGGSIVTPPPSPTGGNFAGDPGDGNFNIGWALGPNGNSTINAADGNLGWPGDNKISVVHNYAGDGPLRASMLDEAINRGFIPSQTFRLSYDATQINAGSADAEIDAGAALCIARNPWPIWLCFRHEPENDSGVAAGAGATAYRTAYRRIVTRYRAAGVTNVAWMPVLMNPYTFTNRDWRNWHADWTGSGWYDDIMMDVFGADTYNPLPGGTTNHSFANMWDSLRGEVEKPGYPVWDYVQPEFGLSYHATPLPDWVAWCTAARDYAKTNRIKNFCYWDNSDDIGRYSFDSVGDANGKKLQGWNLLVNASVKKVTA